MYYCVNNCNVLSLASGSRECRVNLCYHHFQLKSVIPASNWLTYLLLVLCVLQSFLTRVSELPTCARVLLECSLSARLAQCTVFDMRPHSDKSVRQSHISSMFPNLIYAFINRRYLSVKALSLWAVCLPCLFVCLFVCSSGQILLPRHLMNGLNNFDNLCETYRNNH